MRGSSAKDLTFPAPAPNLYLRITKSLNGYDHSCYWYKLDLERQKPVRMVWQSQNPHNSMAVVLKSDIYLLGGDMYFRETHHNYEYKNCSYVYRIDTCATPKLPCFESAPSMLRRRTISLDSCAVLGDQMVFFNTLYNTNPYYCVEIFYPSLDEWVGFFKEDVCFPRELEEILVDRPVVSDPENNRILIHFGRKGLYAFYPGSFKWECLCPKIRLDFFESFVVMNNVLYYCWMGLDNGKELIRALDVSDGFKPLKIVWPIGFEYPFPGKSRCVSLLDLGNGKLCMVVQWHVCLDDEYYYSEDDEDVELCNFADMSKYMLVVTCLILELEKQPPPPQSNRGTSLRQRTELLVKTVSRFNFEFENFVSSSDKDVQVKNAVAVQSGLALRHWKVGDPY